MSHRYIKKINENEIDLSPFPHLIIDNFLEEQQLSQVKDLWPNKNLHNDLRGSNCFYFSSELKNENDEKKSFWNNFLNKHIYELGNLLFHKFYDHLEYKNVSNKIEWGTGYSQENYNKTKPLDFSPHSHFDHDPLWVLTFLIYINDENKNSPGTSLYSIGDNKDERIEKFKKWNKIWHADSDYSDKILKINELKFQKYKTVEFKENRLFCFLDGPFSFHSVNYQKSDNIVNRKSLRFALGFERNKIPDLYNVSADKWIEVFDKNQNDTIDRILNFEHDNFFKKKTNVSQKNFYIDDFPFF